MKRKRSEGSLSVQVEQPAATTDKHISVRKECHLNALSQGYSRTLLAWSSQGTIVFAPPSSDLLSPSNATGDTYGQRPRLYATVPTLDISKKRSSLLSPVTQLVGPDNAPIDRLVFNETGAYLAVADELGSLTIWEQDTIACQFIPRQTFLSDAVDDNDPAGRIVSLRWLHNDAKIHVAVKLSKNGEQWTCQSNSQRGSGPCNIIAKEALVAITSDGRVKLVYQIQKGWKMETLKLDRGDGQTYSGGTTTSKDIISQAAWTQDFMNGPPTKERASLHCLVTIDNLVGLAVLRRDPALGQCISYYKLMIDFRQDPVRLEATLLVNRDPLDFGGDVTHLFVLPTSHTLASALATITLHTDEFGEKKSSLALWDITKSTTALHATFSHLSSVTNIPAPKDEAVYPATILMTVLHLIETAMRVARRRGVCRYTRVRQLDHSRLCKRVSIDKSEEGSENTKNIMTAFDGGFGFPKSVNDNDPRHIATVLSPNLVAYATMHASGRVSVHTMTADPSSPLLSAVLAQKFTNALKKNGTFDDLYLLVEQYLTDDFALKLLTQAMKFSGCRFELSKELPVEQVVSSHVWTKLVSLQYNLYSRLSSGARIASNGILLLQLRTMFMAFMMSCKVEPNAGSRANYPKPQIMGKVWISPKSIPREAVFKEYTVVAMLGYVQWLMDYLVFVVRELLLVAKDLRQKHYDKDQDVPTMSAMIFTTVVRTFLRAGIRAASDLVNFSRRYVEQGSDVDPIHVQAFQMLDSTVRQSPITLDFAAKFLEEIDLIMEKIISEHPNRLDLENKLFFESVIPRGIRKALYTVTERLIGPQSPLDLPTVIFFDTTWLGLSAIRPPGAQSLDSGTCWDTLRKQRLSRGKVRRCNRCGILSAMEDPPIVNDLMRKAALVPGQGPARNWTVLVARNCLCFGTWSLADLE